MTVTRVLLPLPPFHLSQFPLNNIVSVVLCCVFMATLLIVAVLPSPSKISASFLRSPEEQEAMTTTTKSLRASTTINRRPWRSGMLEWVSKILWLISFAHVCFSHLYSYMSRNTVMTTAWKILELHASAVMQQRNKGNCSCIDDKIDNDDDSSRSESWQQIKRSNNNKTRRTSMRQNHKINDNDNNQPMAAVAWRSQATSPTQW